MTLKDSLSTFNLQQQQDFATHDVVALLHQRSQFYDEMLRKLWQQFGFAARQDLALIAVGGYGRREMFPLSDLDILILTQAPLDEVSQQSMNALLNTLWDLKLQVGATIRTIEESITIGREELSVATNMYEGRFLFGNSSLWQQLKERIYQADFWPIAQFYQAKLAEKEERYARYNNTSYNLEPDIKHSPGGLRDLHLLSWIMLRHYRMASFESLLKAKILMPEEYREIKAAETELFRIRFALHLQLKRPDNRLRFDRQLSLSEQLGYKGEGNQPAETMMRDFFQATQSVSQLSQLLLNSFEQSVLNLQETAENQLLDEFFKLQCHAISAKNNECFIQQPETVIRLFHHLAALPQTYVAADTLRHLRLALQKRTTPLCDEIKVRQQFIALFEHPNAIKRAILPMHQLGVLSAYFPAWQAIRGLMQFDLFHIYTVDEHTIRVMLKIESFLADETKTQHPLCHQLFSENQSRAKLYLAALLHDIAKGREGDHAINGAEEAYHFCQQHGLSEDETDDIAWLVKEHLTMSITAQRRDIHDPNVISKFAETVQTSSRLSMLLCLTVADICATNTTLWNEWKRTLFTQLYQFTIQQLAQQLDYRKEAENNRQQALEQIKFALSPTERLRLNMFWAESTDDYFLRHKPTQLVWHALHYLKQSQLPLVLVSNEYARGATEIFVHCDDQPYLFERIAQALSQKKISIHDAQIITGENGRIYDSFIVTEISGAALDALRCQQIQAYLSKILTDPSSTSFTVNKKPMKAQPFKRKTKVRFVEHVQENQVALEIFTLDREGLLVQISHIFNQLGLELLNAKITTIGEKAEDFFVLRARADVFSDEDKQQLKHRLIEELDH